MESENGLEYTLRVSLFLDYIRRVSDTRSTASERIADQTLDTPRSLDLTGIFHRDARGARFPERVLKGLDAVLPRIAMGHEPKYSEQRFRRSVAAFWSSVWPDKVFEKQMRESRKLEDLVIYFVTSTTKSLKKDESLEGGAWMSELHVQISMFLDVLADVVQTSGPSSGDLLTRIQTYRQRINDDNAAASATVVKILPPGNVVNLNFANNYYSHVVKRLFNLSDAYYSSRAEGLRNKCTPSAALEDLKLYMTLLSTNSSVPYTPDDFADPSLWSTYRTKELKALQAMTLRILEDCPELVTSTERPVGDLNTRLESLHLRTIVPLFTYIPPNPALVYGDILQRCLDQDLETLQSLPDDQEVSLGILSAQHQTLLNECATRWRLPDSFRASTFLSAVVDRFSQGLVPAECLLEAKALVATVTLEAPVETWAISDRLVLQRTLEQCDLYLLSGIELSLVDVSEGIILPVFLAAMKHMQTIGSSGEEFDNPNSDPAHASILERIETQLVQLALNAHSLEVQRNEHVQKPVLEQLLHLSRWAQKRVKQAESLLQGGGIHDLDPVSVLVAEWCRLWFSDLRKNRVALAQCREPDDVERALNLYREAKKMVRLGHAFSDFSDGTDIGDTFEPVIRTWLRWTAAKTKSWAEQALAIDEFSPMEPHEPSSSVVDLTDSFSGVAQFLMDLDWPDREQLADFVRVVSNMISVSVSEYCDRIQQRFAVDMENGVRESTHAPPVQKAWYEKAKSTITGLPGERVLDTFFDFTPAMCIKLNNIEALRLRMDNMYMKLEIDRLALLEPPQVGLNHGPESFLFSVKIVLAEGLATDGVSRDPDTFVILSNEQGQRLGKTRTVYGDSDPRWDETFDMTVTGPTWYMISVKHRKRTSRHELLGRAYLRLDPQNHTDLDVQDRLLPLDTQGHLLLRVSMENERDDMQYHFGKVFRCLKRTESDMIRALVDKMTPVLRGSLSTATIRSLTNRRKVSRTSIDYNDAFLRLATAYKSVDYNKAFLSVSSVYKTAVRADGYKIPPPPGDAQTSINETDLPVPGPLRISALRDSDIEAVIHPLFDYLEFNMHTLSSNLSHASMQTVLAKLWKQILMIVEALVVPPLSDRPSSQKPLAEGELEIVLKWLVFLRNFLHLNGDENGLPEKILNNPKFHELLKVGLYYDWATDNLMEECVRGFQQSLKDKASKPTKSLLSQRNLGTIRARKRAKRARPMPEGVGSPEMIMRILRMRPRTQDFLAQQLQASLVVRAEESRYTIKS